MKNDSSVFGIIGMGTMGRNLLLNMADHGFNVSGLDKDESKITLLRKEAGSLPVKGFSAVQDFINSLQTPRAIMMLVPAGKIVDEVIQELTPLLSKGDLIIDGGNSHFSDTNRRVEELKDKGLHFFGMGISGGEEGARRGPSMMPGGDQKAYEVVRPIFEAVAAKVKGDPCVTYVGPGASGHFVKMVHNGIEYGIMQLIAEAYEFMKRGLKLSDEKIHATFKKWNEGRLQSFLIEITRDIFTFKEPGVDHLLVNDIKDEARSKGTGKWTSQIAMDLQAPLTVIDTAVSMRDLSKYKALRTKAAELYKKNTTEITSQESLVDALESALYFSTIISYAQGMHLLSLASKEFKYDLKMDSIAQIWRGGCIIRSSFLQDIFDAYQNDPSLPHLLIDNSIQTKVSSLIPATREVVSLAIKSGIAIPGFTAAISYFDSFTSERMPSNLIQAQRDYFGAHTYERIGKEGVFHTQWIVK
ncbi:NADP-dependent phosphogluconate dehydrogenase [Chryseosolibacter indicus]|uniref:6-phosphogluconate dehydrogenase, decarboxylating n=1 Tax=Chryseosolibacter indicus TaxID=2782351 RepID=A0ABS5VT11_9BACT|nr:NADP-dependent phosphogluconate dehydrogenase [Chryseosolibacter indicus]MBT1704496.1 NADP-dependent phosphogluconate dehydrogenase [Chryseosolibacter indicus]